MLRADYDVTTSDSVVLEATNGKHLSNCNYTLEIISWMGRVIMKWIYKRKIFQFGEEQPQLAAILCSFKYKSTKGYPFDKIQFSFSSINVE